MVKKKVFITGVGGLLGSTLARRLLVKGTYDVAGCDTFVGGIQSNVPDIPFYEIDILDTNNLKDAMRDVDIVFHTAALPYEGLSVFSPAVVAQNIVGGTVSVASAALHNNVNLFINCSSMARYGAQNPPLTEYLPNKRAVSTLQPMATIKFTNGIIKKNTHHQGFLMILSQMKIL